MDRDCQRNVSQTNSATHLPTERTLCIFPLFVTPTWSIPSHMFCHSGYPFCHQVATSDIFILPPCLWTIDFSAWKSGDSASGSSGSSGLSGSGVRGEQKLTPNKLHLPQVTWNMLEEIAVQTKGLVSSHFANPLRLLGLWLRLRGLGQRRAVRGQEDHPTGPKLPPDPRKPNYQLGVKWVLNTHTHTHQKHQQHSDTKFPVTKACGSTSYSQTFKSSIRQLQLKGLVAMICEHCRVRWAHQRDINPARAFQPNV